MSTAPSLVCHWGQLRFLYVHIVPRIISVLFILHIRGDIFIPDLLMKELKLRKVKVSEVIRKIQN